MHIDRNFAVFFPTFGTDIQDLDASETALRNRGSIASDHFLGLGQCAFFDGCLQLLPAGKVARIGKRRREGRVLQTAQKFLRLFGNGFWNVQEGFFFSCCRHILFPF